MLVTHDKLFKKFLSDVQTARDFLEIHLPENLRRLCDLSTLRLVSESLLDPEARSHFTDILYSVGMKDRQGSQTGYIYHLIEHQSTPDALMAFRLMRYSISVMHRHLAQGHSRLPLVVPILYYHGEASPYPHSTDWFDLFDHPDVARNLYTQPFPLVDVTVISDKKIFEHRRIALLEITQKYVRRGDMVELAENPVFLLKLRAVERELARMMFYYMFQAGDSVNPDQLMETLAMGSPEHKEIVMTVAQKLQDRARLEGAQEGRQEGRLEGRQEGRLELARKMLKFGVSIEDLKREADLSDEEIWQLQH
jgi:predicted transposase/invertase (TIGR01784 family)